MKPSLLTGSQNTTVLNSELGRLEMGGSEIALLLTRASPHQPAHPEVRSAIIFHDGLGSSYRVKPIDENTEIVLGTRVESFIQKENF